MKSILFTSLLLALPVFAGSQATHFERHQIHILPDAPASAYRAILKGKSFASKSDKSIQPAIALGERNLAWLNYMNSFRPEDSKLQLTKPGDLKGISIEEPKTYSGQIVLQEHKLIQTEMPEALKKILYSNLPFPQNPPVDEDDYVTWANKVDRNYQTALRWKLMSEWLPELQQERQQDLRGFYFLSIKTENVESHLRSIHTQPKEKQLETTQWLTQMCQNVRGLNSRCDLSAETSIQVQKAYEFYLQYLPGSQKIWNSFFSLHNPRSEVKWTARDPLEMLVPFRMPKDQKITDFLKGNIEDEWKWAQWNLRLDFRNSAAIHAEFEPGAVPHVNALGGDTIVMDANAPLSEWDVQWTIRHEFGHVLGFTDCYLEFYEPKQKAIVTYQLDIENLMCARSGRIQKTHYDTLKKNYFKN